MVADTRGQRLRSLPAKATLACYSTVPSGIWCCWRRGLRYTCMYDDGGVMAFAIRAASDQHHSWTILLLYLEAKVCTLSLRVIK